MGGPNHPFVVWASCFLWLTSMLTITWSLVLFFCVGDLLLITGTDLVIAIVLLSGIIMLPTNVFMLYTIANGERIDHKSKVLCCPLWMLILWIVVINCVGIVLCIQKMCLCDLAIMDIVSRSMKNYRSVPKYKHFIDNLQWSLKCCGLHSYKDWFHYDWYDKLRDYEWDPTNRNKRGVTKRDSSVSDSVPLSCCKSGTCVPNYLSELGTHSIHTKGCSEYMYHVCVISMNAHLVIFVLIIIAEVGILVCIVGRSGSVCSRVKKRSFDVRHLMPVNNNFEASSGSSSCNPDDSDDLETSRQSQTKEKIVY